MTCIEQVDTGPQVNIAQLTDIVNDMNSTSIRFGGDLTINEDGKTYDISPYICDIVDSYSSKKSVAKRIDNTVGFTGKSPDNILGQPSTFVGLDANGIVENDVPFLPSEVRDVLPLGRVIHVDNVNIVSVESASNPGYDLSLGIRRIYKAMGPVNEAGNEFTFSGANLNILKMAGVETVYSANRQNDNKVPHVVPPGVNLEIDPVTWGYLFKDLNQPANNPFTINAPVTEVDSNFYDDGTYNSVLNPNLAPTTASKPWQIQPLYFFTGGQNVRIHYGQDIYGSLANALEAIDIDEVLFDAFLRDALFGGWLIVKRGAINLSDPSVALFKKPPKINLNFNQG